MHLAYPGRLQELNSINNFETNNPLIENNRIKNPNRKGQRQPVGYLQGGREFEHGKTGHKSSKWPERDSNLGLLDCESMRWPVGHTAPPPHPQQLPS